MNRGFIKLPRQFFTHTLWTKARTYSECEAWIFLVKEARFEATPRTESIGGREITWQRGQLPASIRYLSREWQWTERSVRSLLEKLKKKGMIRIDCTQGISIITLCQYDLYSGSAAASCGKTSSGTEASTNGDTQGYTDILMEINKLRKLITQPDAQSPAQSETQPRHSPDTSLKNEKKREEKKEGLNTLSLCSPTAKKSACKTISFFSLKEKLLADNRWIKHASYFSEIPSDEFTGTLSESIDKFLRWIQAIGEEHTVSTVKDAKRRFIYWWKYHELKEKRNERETFADTRANRIPDRETPKDYTSELRF